MQLVEISAIGVAEESLVSSAATEAENEPDLATSFRHSMSLLAASVAVVTTRVDERPWGMTITACCSVSAEPPTVLVSLAATTATARAITGHGEYGLCLLGAHAVGTAKFGAAPGRPKFLDDAGLSISGAGRTPCVSGAIAHLDCEVVQEVAAGDHVVFFGRLREIVFPGAGLPLVYCSRRYQRIVPALELVGSEAEAHALAYSAW
jgi:flavin reductase (DIM6/NTAB) family NADH-FMN oxidoreductase RutF